MDMPGGLVWAQGAALGSLCSSRHFPEFSPQPPIIVLKAKIRMKWIGLEGNTGCFLVLCPPITSHPGTIFATVSSQNKVKAMLSLAACLISKGNNCDFLISSTRWP